MILVQLSLTAFVLQNIGHCYLPADINQTLRKIQKEIEILKQEQSFLYEYCQLKPRDICGPCVCRDDDRLSKKYYCDCRNLQTKRDCLEYKQNGIKINGVYKVHQNLLKIIQVYCDQTTDGGGWAVFQRRVDGSVSFFRDWENYKNGFGQLLNEFWLGNENIFTMSHQGLYPRGNELRIEMTNNKNIKKYAKYDNFNIGNAATKYMLHISGFTGTVSFDGLTYHNARMFSTYDNNNSKLGTNPAITFFGAWWFFDGYHSHLNGLYYPAGKMSPNIQGTEISVWTGIHWHFATFNTRSDSLTFTEMKVRRKV